VARLSFDGYSIKDIVLNVLHHFYPVNVAAPSSTSAPRNSPLKIEELSAKDDSSEGEPTTVVASRTVAFVGMSGAKIYVNGNFVDNIPSTIPLSAGRHKILVRDGKSVDRQDYLTVMAGSSQTFNAEFPVAQ